MFIFLISIIKVGIALVRRFFNNIYVQHWPGLERPIVQVDQGTIQGITLETSSGKWYHSFKGIPYAEPPISELRFCPPMPLERFPRPVLKCLVDKSEFIQPHELFGKFLIVGTEDALYLNVYTPELPKRKSKQYPVMVYIHGGGLKNGTASSFFYDPRCFIEKGVVLVTISYRLGPFGFLCLPSAGISGNFGLKDQRLALEWIHQNIECFGGNPDNVTLFGESAGGWCAYLHYLSANSRKYFHRVICQSGDSCTESALQVDPVEKARKLAGLLGYTGSSDQKVLDTLRRAPARLLTKYQDDVISEQEKSLPLKFLFRPVIEQDFDENAIICQSPEMVLKSFDTIQIPIIQGYTNGEGILALSFNKRKLRKFDQHREWLIPQYLKQSLNCKKSIIGKNIKQFYCKEKQISWKAVHEIRDLFSDLTFLTTCNLSAEWLAKYQPNAQQYHYLFSYDGRFSFMKKILNMSFVEGTCHGDDCLYMFSPPFLPALPADSDEIHVRETLVELWTNFAKYNDPTPVGTNLGFTWIPVTKIDPGRKDFNLDCLEINVKPKMIRNPYPDRMEFWRSIMMRSTVVKMIRFFIFIFKLAFAFSKHILLNLIIRFWPGIERPIVELRQGKVQGVTDKLPNGRKYHFFKGIPYAKPPIGELRFRTPEPLERFNKPVLNCSSDKNFIKQSLVIFDWPVIGTEDGLYLNVYTPSLPVAGPRKFPVMVYIHGGGFRYGTASAAIYDPKYLIQQDVVVVLMFYRLGPLGFLCLPDAGISGNAGLKDQRLALKWVHENIYLFGGDAENVTLFGQSAGSWSTYLHYLSPNSRKYFHRVICQSGDSCTDYAFQVDPEEKARALARMLGYTGNSDQEVLVTLIKASSTSLMNHQYDVLSPKEQSCPLRFLFRPVIEREFSEDSIITQAPEEILKSYDTIHMPIMSGCTSAEGLISFLLSKNRLHEYNQHPEWLVPRFLHSPQDRERWILGSQVKQFYLDCRDLGWDTANETCDLMSDLTFLTSNNLSAEWISKFQPNVHHYHYLFDYCGRFNFLKKMILNSINGACHGDDIFYLFSPSMLPNLPEDSEKCRLRDTYVHLLTNFAKYGNPTPDESGLGFKWTAVLPINKNSDSFDLDSLLINQFPKMVRNVYHERKEFWRNIIKQHSELL
ncbi:uncharacterized protein LOC131434085 [Malaya genurostris]|uniref:uncharacterized protein LOC131434085 n=1 Tax=Malaya genurostris TaxID=325434 RepID=UPI0026F3A087|nr:uncharacterized protein LOC131434085 [Malaya genurostris]